MVTLQDIARECGVSLMTVSRCMRNDPRHSEGTRRLVREAAERLGYRPNPMISTLMAQLRQGSVKPDGSVIALLAFYPPLTLKSSSTWRRFEAGVRERAAELGFGCEWFPLETYPGEAGLTRLRKIFLSRGMNAVIIFPMPAPEYELAFDPEGFALATIGFSLRTPHIHCVSHHHYTALHSAIEEMAVRGYRRIALALPENFDANVGHQWLAALAVHPSRAGQPPEEFVFFCARGAGVQDDGERKKFLAWVRAVKPDLIFGLAPCDTWWEEHLRDRRVRVDYAALDLSPDTPQFGGIDQMSENIGAGAVDILVAQIHRNETGPPAFRKVLHVESHWREGPSIRRPIAASPAGRNPV